jgi:para-aminobenzoate synthetase
MKTLVIDNYDSFTYNLVHLLAEVNQDAPVVVRNDAVDWADLQGRGFDAIVISPGPGRPDRPADFGIAAQALRQSRIPVLGICLGHQGLAIATGGRVERMARPVHGEASLIHHDGGGLFEGLATPLLVGRYHSLAVARPLPEDLIETAWTEDGVPMGLAHRTRPLWGLQFHPESILTAEGRRIIENFRRLCGHGPARRVSVAVPRTKPPAGPGAIWREIDHAVDAEAAFAALTSGAPAAFWLDSSLAEPGRARWSYLGTASDIETHRVGDESLFDRLASIPPVALDPPPPCPFPGGRIGWFGYELRHETVAPHDRQSRGPDAVLMTVERFVAIDHLANRTYVVAVDPRGADWVAATTARLERLEPLPPAEPSHSGPIRFRLDRDRDTYLADVAQCLDWIGEGESYQICLTNEITCVLELDAFTVYRALRRGNPAPYGAFLRWPGGAVMMSSPERFLTVDARGGVETKPIKGTIARDSDPARDRSLAEALGASAKDRAENVMIVDLLRNDLSRVCRPGSVRVEKLCAVETYATVHQLVSTVTGELEPDKGAVDLLRACFPGGSMTGAPKPRTLDLIDRLEQRPRGVYSGALGWLGRDGTADLAIVIRTIVAGPGGLSMGVGGGIVAASTPEGEFDEMLLKVQGSLRAIVTAATGSFDPDAVIPEGLVP